MDSATAEIRMVLASVVDSEIVDALEDDQPFFEQGIVDSLHLVEIIDQFTTSLGVDVAGHELSPENFGSIAGMARFLQAKRSLSSPKPADR